MPSAPTPPITYGSADPPPPPLGLGGGSSGGAVLSCRREAAAADSTRGAGAVFASFVSALASAVGEGADGRAPGAGKSTDTMRLRSPRAIATRRSTMAPDAPLKEK